MRRKDREVTTLSEIDDILQKSHVIHLGIHAGDYPYVVPTNYGYELDSAGHLTLYIHGAPAGRKVDLLAQDGRVGFEIDDGGSLMKSETSDASENSWWYHSVIGTGTAEQITEPDEKVIGLERLLIHETNHVWDAPDDHDLAYVNLYRITVKDYSAKAHARMNPKKD